MYRDNPGNSKSFSAWNNEMKLLSDSSNRGTKLINFESVKFMDSSVPNIQINNLSKQWGGSFLETCAMCLPNEKYLWSNVRTNQRNLSGDCDGWASEENSLFSGPRRILEPWSNSDSGRFCGAQDSQNQLQEFAAAKKEVGHRYMKNDNFLLAADWYTLAIEQDPCNFSIYGNRAQAYLLMGKLKEARADCDISLNLNPYFTKVLIRRARINCLLNCVKEAEEDLQRALILEPHNREVKNLLSISKQESLSQSMSKPFSSSERHILKAAKSPIHRHSSSKFIEQNLGSREKGECATQSAPNNINKERPKRQNYFKEFLPHNANFESKKKRLDFDSEMELHPEEDVGSDLANMFSKMTVSPFSMPKKAQAMVCKWIELRTQPYHFALHLKELSPDDYYFLNYYNHRFLNVYLPMLSDILDTLVWEFIPRDWDFVPHVIGLSKVSSFENILFKMTEKDRACARKLISLSPENIQQHYSSFMSV